MLSRFSHLRIVIKDKNKKRWPKIFFELLHFSWIKKELPTDYFRKFLYRKDVKNYKSYLSLKQFYSIISSNKIVFPEVSKSLNDKLCFYLICKKHNLPSPNVFCHNIKNKFVFNNSEIQISNSKELISFLKNIFNEYNSTRLFIKPIKGIGGQGCFILYKAHLQKQINEIGRSLLNDNYIYQECIVQHQKINEIHSKSINSLRIDTYIDKNNLPHVLSAIMRFGTGDSITDNTHTGGFYISVNNKSQKLQGIGRQDIIEGGGVFIKHPNSDYKLEGFQVPFFKQACDLVLLATKYFPNRIVGWDIAITKSGPVIIEGNHNPSLHVTDVGFGGYLNHPLINDILKEINSK